MPRFIPPHLIVPVALLIFVVWIMLVHRFRKSFAMQQFVAEALGDNTPENALTAFEAAKRRLTDHLNNRDLDMQTRRRIELALGRPVEGDAIDGNADERFI